VRLENIKRAAAVLIAVSLLLPQRSCVEQGKAEILYPLSGADLQWQVILVALFVLPSVLVFMLRQGVASILGRIVLGAVGLYLVSYVAFVFSIKLLIGWYTYTAGASIYLIISLAEFGLLLGRTIKMLLMKQGYLMLAIVSSLYLALTSGCSTARQSSRLAVNSIVIENHTTYSLAVFRNGVPWEMPNETNLTTKVVPGRIGPHQKITLCNVSEQKRERILIDINLMRGIYTSCMRPEWVVGTRHFAINIGTDCAAADINVRSVGYSEY
jgi:hypothetical protein